MKGRARAQGAVKVVQSANQCTIKFILPHHVMTLLLLHDKLNRSFVCCDFIITS